MTELLPEFASFPVFRIFDGELVAFDAHRSRGWYPNANAHTQQLVDRA
jgi:hypothetical protein